MEHPNLVAAQIAKPDVSTVCKRMIGRSDGHDRVADLNMGLDVRVGDRIKGDAQVSIVLCYAI